MAIRRRAPRPRNPLAVVTRKLGQKIKPSAKSYKRRPKHKNPRPDDGGFSLEVDACCWSQFGGIEHSR